MGFSLDEIDEMSIGFMKDILIESMNNEISKYKNQNNTENNINVGKKKTEWRWATQEDFDRL